MVDTCLLFLAVDFVIKCKFEIKILRRNLFSISNFTVTKSNYGWLSFNKRCTTNTNSFMLKLKKKGSFKLEDNNKMKLIFFFFCV